MREKWDVTGEQRFEAYAYAFIWAVLALGFIAGLAAARLVP